MTGRKNIDSKTVSPGKILGGDSKIDFLTRIRRTLVDDFILSKRENPKPTQPEPKRK
jgi:hypothetical protein